jgi:hypothetical protein
MRTRLSERNVVLFIIGTLLACLNVLFLGMTFGFGDSNFSAFQNFCIDAAILCCVLSAVLFIVLCLWSKARAVAIWGATALFALFSLLGGVLRMTSITLIVLVIISAIASAINAKSIEIGTSNRI